MQGLFDQIKTSLINIDPVAYCENNLMLDGKPFRLHGNGYKPFADIFRYIGINSLKQNSKPIILVKGRQVGATTMAAALELYFMSSGLFGTGGRPPMRIIHAFPSLIHVFQYAKTKFNPLMKSAVPMDDPKKPGKKISVIESKLDKTSTTNDSLQFKQFVGDNYIRIESTGLTADRLRGGTVDCIMYDECFPYSQNIVTDSGKFSIGKLYDMFSKGQNLPNVKTYNEEKDIFEYKRIINAWKRDKRELIEIICENRRVRCTPNHKFLTIDGWEKAENLKKGSLIKTAPDDGNFKQHGLIPVKSINNTNKKKHVYDIEVEDNHNFIVTSIKSSKNNGGLIAHNCQDIKAAAMSNANKTLTAAQYGKVGKGIQVYFGTPKSRSSEYFKMWESSTQAYYHLGCEKCENFFPLYTPGSNDWEDIWLHGFIVKCPYCEHTQDKRHAAERGKWIHLAFADEKKKLIGEDNCDMIGFHINQLYNPRFTKEDILNEKPENSPINTERAWQNEVLGEFYSGEMGPITPEEIEMYCADETRKLRNSINISENKKVFAGFDWGKRNDPDAVGKEEADKQGGQSFSTCVVLTEDGPGRLLIDYASIVKKNDFEYKKGFIHEVMRRYSVTQAVGDIGYAHELTEVMQRDYGDRFLASNLVSRVNGFAKVNDIAFPHIILAEREYHIAEVFNVLKKGMIRFPWKDFERISWLIEHCCSMEVKVTFNVVNEPVRRFIKGAIPNDGFMALLNAYLAYKYYATGGFNNMKGGIMDKGGVKEVPAIVGYCPGF
jgi:hypothetical protein